MSWLSRAFWMSLQVYERFVGCVIKSRDQWRYWSPWHGPLNVIACVGQQNCFQYSDVPTCTSSLGIADAGEDFSVLSKVAQLVRMLQGE